MIRLNPKKNQTKTVTHTIFPPTDDYFSTLLSSKEFQNLLETDATTSIGMKNVAEYYNVVHIWNAFVGGNNLRKPCRGVLHVIKNRQDF
jgi:hypothetical protein